MKLATLLLIFADIINVLKNLGLINSNDEFRTPTAHEDAILASRVEEILKSHGVTVPNQIDQVLAILPMILQLAGVK